MIKFNFLIILLCLLFINSCSFKKTDITKNMIQISRGVTLLKRDSLYLIQTVNSFIDSSYWTYKQYSEFIEKEKEIQIFIDDIFYSPDSLKLFSFVILKLLNYNNEIIKGKINDYYFDGTAIVGFRKNKSECWNVFPFNKVWATNYSSYLNVNKIMKEIYFVKFKEYSEYILTDENEWVLQLYNFNINDKRFWAGPVWQKGLRMNGLYNFQTDKYIKKGEIVSEIKMLNIEYPDSILNLFPNCYEPNSGHNDSRISGLKK